MRLFLLPFILLLMLGPAYAQKNAIADKIQNAATYNQPDLPLRPDLVPTLTAFIERLK